MKAPPLQIKAKTSTVDPLLVDVTDAAAMLGISKRHLEDLAAEGRVPASIRLGRSARYRVDELRSWCTAGCPARDDWERMRSPGH